MKAMFLGALSLLTIATISQAAVLDVVGGGNSERFLVLDDGGRLWRMTNDCDDWRLIDTIPGARGLDWDDAQGAIVTDSELLIGQLSGIDFQDWQVATTIPLPAANIVDVGIRGNQYWLWSEDGQVWYGTGGTWSGPCAGPDSPVGTDADSWGRTKAAHR